jgi:hypothetical protein
MICYGIIREYLNKSSPRRRPGSRQLIFLDSGIRRNDKAGLVQTILNDMHHAILVRVILTDESSRTISNKLRGRKR